MEPDPRRRDEDDESERQVPARTPPPPKKQLAEFLAEFEQRLADFPDQPATDAHKALEARAEGIRQQPIQAPPSPPAPEPTGAAVEATLGVEVPEHQADTAAEIESAPADMAQAGAAEDTAPAPAEPAQPSQPHQTHGRLRRRVRGRQRRRRRH
jgi:hypothetical protein